MEETTFCAIGAMTPQNPKKITNVEVSRVENGYTLGFFDSIRGCGRVTYVTKTLKEATDKISEIFSEVSAE